MERDEKDRLKHAKEGDASKSKYAGQKVKHYAEVAEKIKGLILLCRE